MASTWIEEASSDLTQLRRQQTFKIEKVLALQLHLQSGIKKKVWSEKWESRFRGEKWDPRYRRFSDLRQRELRRFYTPRPSVIVLKWESCSIEYKKRPSSPQITGSI